MGSRKKKTYLIVVGVCIVALAVDRLLPTAQVTQPASGYAAPSAAQVSIPETVPLTIPRLPFPRSIRSWDIQSDIRDLFEPPVLAESRDPGQSGSEVAVEENNSTTDQGKGVKSFRTAHRLNAVMVNGALRVAVVDGVWVREGQEVDGCVLDRISGNSAAFSCYDGNVTLTSGIDQQLPSQR